MKRLVVVILLGAEGPSAGERWVAGCRLAAARDAVEMAQRLPGLERIVVATSEISAASHAAGLPVEWDFDPPGETFHFGRRLAGLMARFPAEVYAYLGAGSLPLLPLETLAEAVGEVARANTPTAV